MKLIDHIFFHLIWRKNNSESSICIVPKKHQIVGGGDTGFFRKHVVTLLIVASYLHLLSTAAAADVASNQEIYFNIPEQRADLAIVEYAEQADVTFIIPLMEVEKKIANSVVGSYTKEEAIILLLRDTGLEPELDTNEVLRVYSQKTNDPERGVSMNKITRNEKGIFAILSAAIVSVFLPSQTVLAQNQTQERLVLEEIVVTAQQRVQSLQEVPISIEVVSGADILTYGYQDLGQMQGFVPALSIDPGTQNQTTMIRGTGTQGSNFGLEQAVGIFSDGVHFGRSSQIHNAFLDLERIEIMRGPQPVFFGQNTSAGAISMTTKKPTPEWEGNLTAEYGSNNSRKVQFGVGGPISDTLGIRLAGIYDATDGHLRDILTGSPFPHREVYTGRVILQWMPSDRFSAIVKAEMSDLNRGMGSDLLGLSSGNLVAGTGRRHFVCCFDEATLALPIPEGVRHNRGLRLGPNFFSLADTITRARTAGFTIVDVGSIAEELDLVSREDSAPKNAYLKLSYMFANNIELTSLTAYSKHQRDYVREFGQGGPYVMAPLYRDENLHQWSQEIRLSSPMGGAIEWMTGVYYQLNEMDHESTFWVADNRKNDGGSRNNSDIDRSVNSDDATWKSAFATVTFNFLDNRASFDAGARYTQVKKFGRMVEWGSNWIVEGGGGITAPRQVAIGHTPFLASGRVTQDDYKDTAFNPQVNLRYRISDNISTYAKYAQGYKAGGFDTSVVWVVDPEVFQFDNEKSDNYEIGAKGVYFDGRVATDLSLFWNDMAGLQYSSSAGEEARNRTQNIASQRVRGAEFSGRILLNQQLTLGFGGALMDGKMLSYPGANCTDDERNAGLCIENGVPGTINRSGLPPPRLPNWEFIMDVDYWMLVWDRYKVSLNVKGMISDGYITNDSWNKTVKMDSHEDMSLNLGFGDSNDVWRISVWGRNLLEPLPTYHPEFNIFPNGTLTPNTRSSQYRSFGVQLSYNYK